MRNKEFILLAIVSMLCTVAAAQPGMSPVDLPALEAKAKGEPNSIPSWLELGQAQAGIAMHSHNAGLMDAARASFEHVLKIQGDEPHALVWQGMILSIQAGELFQSGKLGEAQQLLTQGFKAMDHGIQVSPKDPALRRLRGETNLRVPEFLGRTALGVADLEIVIADPSFEKSPAPDQARVYQLLGTGYSRAGQADRAQAMWQKAVALAPESNGGQEAQKLLQKSVPQTTPQTNARPDRLTDIPDNVGPIMAVASIRFKPGAAAGGSGRDFQEMFAAMSKAKGFMGVRFFQSSEPAPMHLAISWWKDRQALVDWYYHPAHQKLVKAFHVGTERAAQPVQDAITHIGLDFYAPLRIGMAIGEKFGPTQKAVE